MSEITFKNELDVKRKDRWRYNGMEIGRRIRAERKKTGYANATDFGQYLGLGRSQTEQIEQGKRLPEMDELVKMADLFNCEIGYILGEYPTKFRETADVMEATGLSEKAVTNIEKLKGLSGGQLLCCLLESAEFWAALEGMEAYVQERGAFSPVFESELSKAESPEKRRIRAAANSMGCTIVSHFTAAPFYLTGIQDSIRAFLEREARAHMEAQAKQYHENAKAADAEPWEEIPADSERWRIIYGAEFTHDANEKKPAPEDTGTGAEGEA